ncbi:MAG: porin OmpA [Arsenophonus sp. NC-WZS1-MAG3]
MKKIAIVLAIFATAAQAAPKDNIWYTGAKLGWLHFEDTVFYPYGKNVDSLKTKRDQVSTGVYLGYEHNQYLGFELGYDLFGKMRYSGQSNNESLKSIGVQLTTRLSYPLTDELDIYTRLGGMIWPTEAKENVDNQASFKEYDTSISPIYALGLEYAITKELITRLDYQWVNYIGDKDSLPICPDNGVLSFGIGYRFNQDVAPMLVPASVGEPIKNKHFTLYSDVLFKFNNHTLKPAGKVKLDKLYSELTDLDPIQGHVMVLGYTDRIGSPTYNKPLSHKRADEVMSYLIFKGIPRNVISSQGRGEENSITGSTCNNIKSRQALINCLALDRRVEIEIQGTYTEVTSQP